nr:unnamed protein product [Digitaria exilis]
MTQLCKFKDRWTAHEPRWSQTAPKTRRAWPECVGLGFKKRRWPPHTSPTEFILHQIRLIGGALAMALCNLASKVSIPALRRATAPRVLPLAGTTRPLTSGYNQVRVRSSLHLVLSSNRVMDPRPHQTGRPTYHVGHTQPIKDETCVAGKRRRPPPTSPTEFVLHQIRLIGGALAMALRNLASKVAIPRSGGLWLPACRHRWARLTPSPPATTRCACAPPSPLVLSSNRVMDPRRNQILGIDPSPPFLSIQQPPFLFFQTMGLAQQKQSLLEALCPLLCPAYAALCPPEEQAQPARRAGATGGDKSINNTVTPKHDLRRQNKRKGTVEMDRLLSAVSFADCRGSDSLAEAASDLAVRHVPCPEHY